MRVRITFLFLVSLMSLPHALGIDNPRLSDTLCHWVHEPSVMAPERQCRVCCTSYILFPAPGRPQERVTPPPTSARFGCCLTEGCIP